LLKKNTKWEWYQNHTRQFEEIKQIIAKCDRIHIFDPSKLVYMVTNASPYSVGVQLCNNADDGSLLTVACASTKLTACEQNYFVNFTNTCMADHLLF